jgi:hypothetical protein
MTRPVRYSGGHARYTGRLDRRSFMTWCASADGVAVLEPIASRTRFALFGRWRAARRRVWRQLTAAARSKPVAAPLQREIDAYVARLATIAHARDLPRVGIELRRLVVVPRFFANAAIDRRIDAALELQPTFAAGHGRKPLRDWFIFTLIDAIEAGLVAAKPSPTDPLPAGHDWIVVGVNDRFEWRIPFAGPAWPGHYYLLELTRMPLTRAVRKATRDAVTTMEASLPSLSRAQRDEILRQAELSLIEIARASARSA